MRPSFSSLSTAAVAVVCGAVLASAPVDTPASAQERAQNRPAPAVESGKYDEGVCAPVARELGNCRRMVGDAKRTKATAERESAACKQELEATSSRLQQSIDSASTCKGERDRICAETSAFIDNLAQGQSQAQGDLACVKPEQQTRLQSMASGWSNAMSWLSQLTAYELGESDVLPRPRSGNTSMDRAMQRLSGSRGGGFHRRLLVEALKTIAPRTWEQIRAGGASALEAWFSSSAPLDPSLVAEAQRVSEATSGPAGPRLATALHLVHAFQIAADCDRTPHATKICGRAQQLQQMLESTGPLVKRGRIQEIWATQCSAISAAAILPWIEDLPTSQLGGSGEAWQEIAENAHAKIFACYLDDATNHLSFGRWLKDTLPAPKALTAARLRRVDAIRDNWKKNSREDVCARAVRAMQTFVVPPTCRVPPGEFRGALSEWAQAGAKRDGANVALGMCAQYAQLLWEGKAASIDRSFAHPPSLDEMVSAVDAPPTPMWRLRAHCDERRARAAYFPQDIAVLASFGRSFGEGIERDPFRVDPASLKPIEYIRFDVLGSLWAWFRHVATGTPPCKALGLDDDRCQLCNNVGSEALYDCSLVAQLDFLWDKRTRKVVVLLAALAFAVLAITWVRRFWRARRRFGEWAREAMAFFDSIGLACRRDRLRFLFPSRYDMFAITLPPDVSWQRWGAGAVVVRAPFGRPLLERDVNHAAFIARRLGMAVALVEHDDDASPDLSAVRAMLEWAGRGGTRAVQILPISSARIRWCKSADDVLELVEESSLRGNPFELRGRVLSSTQFFNRERLVSGLLAAAEAGHWMVITGLRRFGKSSLALEVARRLPGPSAYVDLAGFDHEIRSATDPAAAADKILRFVCLRLLDSARTWWPDVTMPELPKEEAAVDMAALTLWFRELSRAQRESARPQTPLLIVIDELEQSLSGGPERLGHALDVLAIVIGRLKSAVGDAALPDGGLTIGVFLTSALHPLLWAPLRTLAQQSIMGTFQRVCVPCLDEDAASTMMRNLGGRQGIRFQEAALTKIVAESQGVPLLLRRLGASILELYDAERARQGSLGAVEVGSEGTREAIEREAREGAPTRVWIETEIAGITTVTGVLLRKLAHADGVSSTSLVALAKQRVGEDFRQTGVAETLPADEFDRRAEEAAHVIVQLLYESGLIEARGDLTAPDGYVLPDGAIRRVLTAKPGPRFSTIPPAVAVSPPHNTAEKTEPTDTDGIDAPYPTGGPAGGATEDAT